MESMDSKYFVGEPYWTTPHNIKVDEKIAGFNPAKTKAEYEALALQIREEGQIDPVYIRDGLLGDGRHRMQIAQELGAKLLVQEIDSNMPDDKYILLCNKNVFGARNANASQLAIKAFGLHNSYGYTVTKACAITGVKDRKAIGYIKYILGTRHSKVLLALEEGEPAVIVDNQGNTIYKGIRLKTIKERIAKLEEEELLEIDNSCEVETTIDYNDYLNTETAKEIFWTNIGKNEFVSKETKKLFCELLNLKYKLKDK